MAGTNGSRPARRIPLWFKLVYTIFVAVLVPYYWYAYGPTNFLYYCDVALLVTTVALWLESSLLASAPAVGILLPQALWMVDFLCGLVGVRVPSITAYMFDPSLPLFVRGLSFFHFWLPIVLVWLVFRLGYDRRALPAWTVSAWLLMLVCYFLMPPPPPDPANPNIPVNINYVYGTDDKQAQTWMPPLAWLGLLMVGLPLLAFLPTHLVLRWLCPDASEPARSATSASGALPQEK